MRGTVAKRLRRKAVAGTVGQPDRVYTHKNYKKFQNGFETSTCVLGFCTRGVYQQLKVRYKKQKG